MSDSPIEIKDLVGLSKPLEKFIDVVAKGTGALYRPTAIRNEAAAESEAIKKLAEARAEAFLITKDAEAKGKIIDVAVDEGLLDRTKKRFIFQEITRQSNIESILYNAEKCLPESVSEKPVNEDWRTRFFNIAQDITDSDMQAIWGKVLAGEISSPNSYSLRSLDVLRNLTQTEAKAFSLLCKLVFHDGSILKYKSENDLDEFGLSYGSILNLRNAGLVVESNSLFIKGHL